ncbi:hypothetical protein [Luteolibacter sp. LG18]|uniref:hypothetical protein n=1 Tax=Luteolibacter sp. LG18 TaxID=2819286 RepID=UPI0030C6723C
MKRLPWLVLAAVLPLSSCKDPAKFTRPTAEDIGRYRAVALNDLKSSSAGETCAILVYGSASALDGGAAAPEMIVETAAGQMVTGYLKTIGATELVVSIPFRDASGVMTRKEIVVPRRMVKEFRLKE